MTARRTLPVLLFVLLAFVAGDAVAQVTYTWNGGATAAWNNPASWSPNRSSVAATDVLVFSGGGSITATAVPTETIGELIVQGSTNVTLQSAGAVTVTINGGIDAGDLQVQVGSQLNFGATAGANAITMHVVAGAIGSISGSMTFSSTTGAVNHRLTAASVNGISFTNGAVFTAGTNSAGNPFGTINLNSIRFMSGSTFVFTSGANPFGATRPSSVVVFQTGSLYKQQSSNLPSLSGRTYANFEMVSGTVSPVGGTAVSIDDLTVSGGTLNWGMTGTGHSIKGHIVVSGGTLAFTPASAGTVNLNGSSAQTITGSPTLNDPDQTINVNNANGITLNSNVTFQQGTLQLTNGNIIVTAGPGLLTINSTANVSRTSGHVIGNLRKQFSASGSKVFEVGTANGYSPFTANVTAGTPGNITCRAVQGPQPNMNASTSIQRYWVLTADPGITADLTFQYLDPPDVMGNEAIYEVYRVSGGIPTAQLASVVNTGTNTATLAGVSAFSDWTVGEFVTALPLLTVTDVSQVETTGGTTTFTFQVNLDAAAPGNVTFDVATSDGTAQDDNPASEDDDYVAIPTTPVTITTGNSSAPVNVTVNGDISPETNENFFVNVTNVVGATVSDGEGEGTIQNDDVACADLSINDVTQVETDAGTTTFAFTVSLSQAGCGTVTFDIATADGTAQDDSPATEDNDYVPQSLTGQTITFPATYTFNVQVNGDGTPEPDQTFFVNITNVSPGNAQVADGQGLGTIVNDDFTRIHDVQGNGTASPLAGQNVTMRGIVTLLKSNGFFLQEELADYDADPNTSEGIFVFTSTPPTVAVGHDATVTGTVVEFNGMTEISPVTSVTTNSTGNPLPTAVTLTVLDLPPTAGPDQPQLEKYEGMRLLAPSLVTVAPNDSFFDVETVLPPQPRPFREPGIPASDPIPPDPTSGLPDCCIPIWDENPERLNVDTNGRAGSTGETLTSNVTLTSVTGPLDFSFGRYRLINEANLTRTADMSAVPVPAPAANEFTIAGYNIENFNNNATQRQKAALTIRDVLLLPDIIGTVEIFDLADLQALATEIQTISGVTYSAHLIEQDGTSEDSDQDVGFLIKTSRVSVTSVTAEKTTDTFINPNTSLPELLHDRPPLLLTGTVDPSGPNPLPVFVIVNHLRSFIDVELVTGEGPRVRAKRKAQAESLADLLNDLQTANPTTPVISVGDYNAFQFNSGYDDSISVLKGMPTPDDQIVVDQSPDLLNPDYSNLFEDVPAAQRYSFIFEGTPQSLDHMLVNTAADALNTGIAVARVNADFPEASAAVYASNAARPERNSDHDPVVGYFLIAPDADVSITKTLDTAGPYFHGQSVTYTLTVANAGPSTATGIDVTDTPANLTITSVSGACASLPCTITSLAASSNTNITVTATITAAGAFDNSATADADENDSVPANNTDSTGNGGSADPSANVSITKTLDTAGPYFVGESVTYTINVANAGPSTATNINVTDATSSNLTITNVSGACASFSPCTIASLASGANTNITVTATIDAGGSFGNDASATATENDPDTGDNTDTGNGGEATASANVSITKTLETAGPYIIGQSVTYTIEVANAGPSTATTIDVTDTPANLTITGVSGSGCAALPCTIAALASGASTFITVTATIDSTGAFSNTATADAAEDDPDGSDNSASDGDSAGAAADLQVTKTDSPDPVTAGTNLTYTITVTNAGPSDAATVALADTVPANTTFVSLTNPGWSCTMPAVGGTGAINCSIATFPAAGSAVFTLVVNVNAGTADSTVLSNTATVTSATTDPNAGNNSDTATTTVGVGSADLSITKTDTASDPVTAGTNLTYTITVNNAGPSNATTVDWSDLLPPGTSFVSLSQPGGWSCSTPPVGTNSVVSCSIASLGVTSAVFTLVVNVNADVLAISNTATVTTATTDPNGTNNSDTETTTVNMLADVQVTKTDASDPVTAGTNITYTITVTNAGPSDASAVTLDDTTPAGTTFVGMGTPGGSSCTTPALGGTGAINCSTALLAAGANAVFTLVVQADPSLANGTIITNTATVSAATTDPNGANDSDTETTTVGVGSADLSITKTDSPDPVNSGTNLTYTITVNNAGPTNASTVSLSDTLPANTTFVSLASPAGWSCTTPAVGAAGTVTCTNPSVAMGDAVFTLTVAVGAPTPPGTVISNTATVSSATTDPNTGNESATETTTVLSPATLSATKSVSGTFIPGASIVTYTIVITNSGPSMQHDNPGNEFIDVLPAELTLVSATATSGTAVATVGTNTVTWNGSIPASGNVTITINATINPTITPGTIVGNVGTVNYDADGNGTNESTTQTNGTSGPTTFAVAPAFDTIPTLDELALLALAAMLAALALLVMKK